MRRRVDPRQAAVIGLALAAVAAALYQAPSAFRRQEDRAADVAATPRASRQLLAGRQADMNTDFFVTAAQTLPPAATFAVITGPGVQVSNDIVLAKAPAFGAYYLLPRR